MVMSVYGDGGGDGKRVYGGDGDGESVVVVLIEMVRVFMVMEVMV